METSRTLSVCVARDPAAVYAFAADPANLPRWASGLGSSIAEVEGRWVAQTDAGPVTIRFAVPNTFGVLDHWVTLQDGPEIYVPMRVVPLDSGSEVLFTLRRQPGMSDDAFAVDAAWVERDLLALKNQLEATSRVAKRPHGGR